MNSQAPSVMAWRLSRSAISAGLVYFREIGRTAFWEFCNTIGTKRTCWRVPRRSAFEGIVLQKSFGGMGLKFSEAWALRLNNDVGDHVATRQTHWRFWQRGCGSIERRLSLVSVFGGNLAAAAFGLLQPYLPGADSCAA